jgi:hypothetical protein
MHRAMRDLGIGSRLRGIGAAALELLDVGAGREGLAAGAAQHHAAQLVVGREFGEGVGQALPHDLVHGVHLVGLVEGHGRDEVVALDQDERGHVGLSLS